jgi:hypothetical protein
VYSIYGYGLDSFGSEYGPISKPVHLWLIIISRTTVHVLLFQRVDVAHSCMEVATWPFLIVQQDAVWTFSENSRRFSSIGKLLEIQDLTVATVVCQRGAFQRATLSPL